MTTLEIETYANEEDMATGSNDVNLAVRLRRKVIPKFEADVGHCSWRRKTATIAVAIGDREYDLPTDFSDMLDWPVYDLGGTPPIQSVLLYIGENAPLMGVSEADAVTGTPSTYWIKRLGTGTAYQRNLYLGKIPSAVATIRYAYLSAQQFSNFTDSVEQDNYIPPALQWALVEALKMELYRARFGINDPRFQSSKAAYDEYVINAQEYAEPGRRNIIKKIGLGPA